jgi:hypothetical protein
MSDLEKLKNMSVSDLGSGLSNAVIENEIEELKYLFKHPYIQDEERYQHYMNVTFSLACKNGSIHIAELLLNSPEFKLNADINSENGEGLIKASENDDLEMVKYLTSHPNFDPKVAMPDDAALFSACLKGNVDIIDYFYSLPQLKERFDSLTNHNFFMLTACEHGQTEVVKYFLTSPYLKESFINYDINKAFKIACDNNQSTVIEYFIFEYNIEETPFIKNYLEHKPDPTVKNLFINRDLNQGLHSELSGNDSIINKKPKI